MFNSLRITITSPDKVFKHTALDDNAIKIGRSLRCDFSVPLEDLSREHCLFEMDGEKYFITDLGSSNGVWVNDERIPAHEKTLITPDDVVILSNLYTFNINPVEIKTRSDVVIKQDAVVKKVNPETATVSFQLEYPDEKVQLKKQKISRTRTHAIEAEDGKTFEGAKMLVGFLIVMGFITYYFLEN